MGDVSNIYYAELMKDFPIMGNPLVQARVAHHMRWWANHNGPYAKMARARGEKTIPDHISDAQMMRPFAASYFGVKYFGDNIDYNLAGNADGLTKAGSNPWTCEHKIVQKAGKANAPAGWNTLQKTLYYWTVPYVASRLDRPSQIRELNKSGNAKSPFKGGFSLLDDLFSSVLTDYSKEILKAKLKAITEENKKNGKLGSGGCSDVYSRQCKDTAEERGVNNMARNKATGIYARMTTAQDEQLAAMVARANFAEHATPPEVGKLVSEFIKANCVDQEKLAAIEKERTELSETLAFVKTKESQQAKVPKLEAELAALNGKSAITTDVVLAVAGPATIAQMKAMLAQPKRLE